MNRTMLWTGAALIALGAAIFLTFVLPWIGGRASEAALASGHAASGPSVLAVAVASFGLAAGSALLGIGLGRWRRPRPSPHDGSPEA
jgi:membrane protein implicated in regulation of membrane protease activity